MVGLGNRIKQIRGDRSQEEFAALLGLDRSTIASYETERREPDLKTMLLIAKVGNTSLDWLAGAGKFNDITIEQARDYTNQEWHDIIDLAVDCNITPDKLRRLISAALALK